MESDFTIKAINYFNHFLVSQCTPLVINSKLPEETTFNSTPTLNSTVVRFWKNIRSLNVNKAHGYDDIWVSMKKNVKQIINNYRPAFYLPICYNILLLLTP